VLALNKQRGELSLLQRDVDVAQRAFEAVSAGASQSKLQSLTNQTNVMRLADAVEPLHPAGLTDQQAITVGAVAGVLLAIAGAFLLELANRRVRTADDLFMALELPVLASIPVAGTPAPLLRLGASARRMALSHGRSTA
jgi:capsular polysaccharide biosynthesis protein